MFIAFLVFFCYRVFNNYFLRFLNCTGTSQLDFHQRLVYIENGIRKLFSYMENMFLIYFNEEWVSLNWLSNVSWSN